MRLRDMRRLSTVSIGSPPPRTRAINSVTYASGKRGARGRLIFGGFRPTIRAISARMSFAAADGSSACVIGRPTTKQLAPEVIAIAGVTTRFWSPCAAPAGRMPGTTSTKLLPHAARPELGRGGGEAAGVARQGVPAECVKRKAKAVGLATAC